MNNKIYDIIIIGLGPAGMTAAIYCARKGLKTLILGKEVGGQVAKTGPVENYLGFGVSTGTDLTKTFDQHVEKFDNVNHFHNVLVKDLKKIKNNFLVETEKGDKYEAKAIIIASGRNPRH